MSDSNQQNSNQENLATAIDNNDSNELTGLSAKQAQAKEALIEQLRKTPIVQIACEKFGIGRTTFYRWRKEDREFAAAVEVAINSGADLVSDMAESKLVSSIKEGNLSAIYFWLKNRHKSYATKLEMVNAGKPIIEQLTPEQEAIVQKALELSTFTLPEDNAEPQINPSPNSVTPSTAADDKSSPEPGSPADSGSTASVEEDLSNFKVIPLG